MIFTVTESLNYHILYIFKSIGVWKITFNWSSYFKSLKTTWWDILITRHNTINNTYLHLLENAQFHIFAERLTVTQHISNEQSGNCARAFESVSSGHWPELAYLQGTRLSGLLVFWRRGVAEPPSGSRFHYSTGLKLKGSCAISALLLERHFKRPFIRPDTLTSRSRSRTGGTPLNCLGGTMHKEILYESAALEWTYCNGMWMQYHMWNSEEKESKCPVCTQKENLVGSFKPSTHIWLKWRSKQDQNQIIRFLWRRYSKSSDPNLKSTRLTSFQSALGIWHGRKIKNGDQILLQLLQRAKLIHQRSSVKWGVIGEEQISPAWV